MTIEKKYEDAPVDYLKAMAYMQERHQAIVKGQQSELLWFLEHPHVYTAGTSAKSHELLNANEIPVYQTNRGGKYTYHGPGQLIIYTLINLKQRKIDVRSYVKLLENWVIRVLNSFEIEGYIHPDRVGVWVHHKNGIEEKIAAIGLRVSQGVSWHGLSLNVSPDLNKFNGIIPCGLNQYGVTSLEKLGISISFENITQLFSNSFEY